ncbi:hypothetical protein E3P77_03016 [Wallemia ichthyophaga]|nr:hypothetical protein E3P77_03016 [Wallemia ichthyophaga]
MNTPTKPIQSKFVPSPSVKRLFNSPNYSILSASPQISRSAAVDFDLNYDETGGHDDSINLLPPQSTDSQLIDKLRLWRHDAMMQHLYTTAQFWGDKCLHLTNDPNDAFWLAQIYFYTHSYLRAEQLLTNPFNMNGDFIRLYQISVFCRYLTAQSQLRLGKWHEALELLGDTNPFNKDPNHGYNVKCHDGGIKIESSLCHLRGLIHLHLNSPDKAKESFIEALSLDVKNYDAFIKLVGGSMLSDEEEWHFVQSLHYKEQIEHDSDFVKLMYTTQLKKNPAHAAHIDRSRDELCLEKYGFEQNVDILQSRADSLYSQLRYGECFKQTTDILKHHPSHPTTLPLHIACMQHLPNLRSSLFLLAHQLIETDPDSAVSWYAVGVYYYLGSYYQEARRYLSKSSLMDPRFQPAWIAFGHAFALEGEHDSAITAYSTASRLFPGTHLALLYIAMQHIQLANNGVAMGFLAGALSICTNDPAVYHEMGVVSYFNLEYSKAVEYFGRTLELEGLEGGVDVQEDSLTHAHKTTATTYLGLGQAQRKLKQLAQSKASLLRALQVDDSCTATLTTLGLVHNELGEMEDAIEVYHKSLSILPGDAMTTELLKLAVSCNVRATSAEKFNRLPEAWRVGGVGGDNNNNTNHTNHTNNTLSFRDDSSILSQSNSNIDMTRHLDDEESMLIE